MAVKMCPKGHYYDNEKYFTCPYCGVSFDFYNLSSLEMEEETRMLPEDREIDNDKTVAYWEERNRREYVTGWLVCVEGPEKGRDYRLHYGFNRIGRSYQMDVCVEADLQITRDNHCSIIYEQNENVFYLKHSTGTITYLNGKILMKAERLYSKDKIRLGQSIFVFIAFCEGDIKWDER